MSRGSTSARSRQRSPLSLCNNFPVTKVSGVSCQGAMNWGFSLPNGWKSKNTFYVSHSFFTPGRKKYHKLSLCLVGENSCCVGWQGFLRILVLLSHKNRTKLPALERIIIPRFPYFELVKGRWGEYSRKTLGVGEKCCCQVQWVVITRETEKTAEVHLQTQLWLGSM